MDSLIAESRFARRAADSPAAEGAAAGRPAAAAKRTVAKSMERV
jgi:hypothetical protein